MFHISLSPCAAKSANSFGITDTSRISWPRRPKPRAMFSKRNRQPTVGAGNLAGAKDEIEAMKALRTTLQRADQSYWADRTEEQMLAISAWVALKEGAQDQGLRFMQAAADSEDGSLKHVAMENRLYPFRE